MSKTAVIAGATGLIGKELTQLLLDDPSYTKVVVWVRKKTSLQHAKLEQLVINFDRLAESAAGCVHRADVFCTLGTTIKKAKTKDAFRKVDYEYPLQLAKICQQEGASQFHIVTAMGANAASSIFYNKVKGQLEDELGKLSLNSLHIYRPSLLLGDREELRVGERIGAVVSRGLTFAMVGGLMKYRPIHARTVALAMLAMASRNEPGPAIHESVEIVRLCFEDKERRNWR